MVLTMFFQSACTQEYALWFLEQAKVGCRGSVVGYASPSRYQDSSAESALKNASLNYARNEYTLFEGGQAFWSTEIGNIWMGSSFTETFDSTLITEAAEFLQPLDSLQSERLVAYLFAPSGCELNPALKKRISLKGLPLPGWISKVPESGDYYYATGIAPEYYYEPSSWIEAEQIARKNIAGTVYIKLMSMQKQDWESQDIQNQEVSAVLERMEVAARWKDLQNHFYYVLVRMPK